jgi:uncharacterized protein
MTSPFEWDENKAKANLKKHGVSFQEASSVFYDLSAVSTGDTTHSAEENRFLIIGQSNKLRILLVVYIERGENIRIISARRATRQEVMIYEEGK